MTHPLVHQLHFTRSEWLRGLHGVSEEEAARHFGPMNCISWTVGHLAWHEQHYWLERAQGKLLFPELNELYAYRAPMSTPRLEEMLERWYAVTRAADAYLESLTTEALQTGFSNPSTLNKSNSVSQSTESSSQSTEQISSREGKPTMKSLGSAVRRVTYHYWYHIGEIQAIRQMLGHTNLPEYVGNIEAEAPYLPE